MFSSSTTTLISTLLCLSTLITALPQDLTTRQQQCRHQPFPINGKQYTLSCDVDRPGGDYAAIQPGTLAYCLNACTSDPKCVSASWVPTTKFCYLKDTVTWEALSSSVSTTLVVGTGCQSRQRVIGGRQCAVQCGTDYTGADYKQVYYGSFEACAQACGADVKCVTAQYHEDTGYCYMKTAFPGAPVTNGIVSTISCGNGTAKAY